MLRPSKHERAYFQRAANPWKPPLARRIGGATFSLIDIGFDILTAAGSSTASPDDIPLLEGGAHDPNQRGFTLQQGELSLMGAVDPYFIGEVYAVFGTDEVELEEAFATTISLPWNLELEAGYFFTDFGRINATHPHAWQWLDQPVINTRLFGGEGQRAVGVDLSWLSPLPWFSELSLGIAVGMSMRVTGLLFTFGSLILPPLTTAQICRETRPMFAVSAVTALATAAVGFVLAHGHDHPPAQMAVAVQSATLVAAWCLRRLAARA